MKELHLIQKDTALTPWPKEKGSREYESGYWDISPERAKEAIGAEIYFHKKQAEASFFGGRITGFRIKTDAPWCGRVIFSFESANAFRDRKTGRDGWSMEMKIVW